MSMTTAALQQQGRRDARAADAAESVAPESADAGERAAAGGRKRRGPRRAASDDCGGRGAERHGRRRVRADVLRIGAPVQDLVAELDVDVARGAEKIYARRGKRWRGIRFGEVEKTGASDGVV